MNIIKKIWKNKWILRNLVQTIYFNFRYLPLRQAVHLPILLYKPVRLAIGGKIFIKSPVRFGMITLGRFVVGIYPNSGFVMENSGVIEFNGSAQIGNDSSISVGRTGRLSFGDNFGATCGLRIACYHKIHFSDNVLVGWNNLFSDTDFYKLTRVNEGCSKGYGSIEVGHDTWIANGCKIYKNVKLPPCSVVSSDTVIANYSCDEEYVLLGNNREVVVRKSGIFRDKDNDKVEFCAPD
jgi:acetyltransferase-like isoleucine patch superfamily enzyme